MRRLVLFDIDGTLLSAGRVSRETLAEAFREACGGEIPLDGYEFSGKTDPQIMRELLTTHVPDADLETLADRALALYLDLLERRIEAQAVVVAKRGAEDLLRRLEAEPDVTLALLTGNHERGARAKLAPIGFNAYFPFGAFGSDHADRYELPPIAVGRARTHTGRDFGGKQVVIVGDSIHDVACGRRFDVKSVAVASGVTAPERLARENPDYLFDHFGDTEAVVEAILA
jgi:phosphoglycolate phosphatase-like HAD superfamily hydrolase